MDVSIIIFSGIVVCGISAVPLILKGIHKLVKDYFKFEDKKQQNAQEHKIEEVKIDLQDAVDNGALGDLINAAKQLGEENRKKHKNEDK